MGARAEAAALEAARATVVEQFGGLLARDDAGSRSIVADRVRAVAVAEREGDVEALRSAVMELAVASGAWALTLDVEGLRVAARTPGSVASLV